MLQELQRLTDKMTAVAESTVEYAAEVAKDSKQDMNCDFQKLSNGVAHS